MANIEHLPRYQSNDFHTYISQLRKFVFFSQQDAADYFRLHRARISHYENPSEPDRASAGYLACLVKLVAEREMNDPSTQIVLLSEANRAFLALEYTKPFSDWTMLCQVADQYLAEQHKKYIDKQIVQNFPKKLTKREQVQLLKDRIGPASYHEFVGLGQMIDSLIELLTHQGPPWIISLTGLGGIGKTSLAHMVAQKVVDSQLFDNVGWLGIKDHNEGFEKLRRPAEQTAFNIENLSDQLLLQFAPDVHKSAGASNLNALKLLQIRLTQIPHLIILDNLDTFDGLDDLLPKLQSLTNPTKFLLTSRTNLNSDPNIYPFPLIGLDKNTAIALMQQEAKLRNVGRIQRAGDPLLENIYEVVGGNPLALRLIVGQTYSRSIDTILTELKEVKGSIHDPFFDFIYKDAWQHLGHQARAVLLGMLLATDRGATVKYLSDLTQLPLTPTRSALDELTNSNLVNSNDAPTEGELRYTTHNLTRSYLRRILTSSTQEDHSVLMISMIVNSIHYVLKIIQREEGILSLEDQEHSLHVLWYALNELSIWHTTRLLILALSPKIEQAGLREIWIPYLTKGIQSSSNDRIQDRPAEAELRFHLGILRQRLGDYSSANQEFSLSARIFAELGEPHNQAKALNRKAYVSRLQGDLTLAQTLTNQALELLQQEHPERAYSFLVLGTIEQDLRNFENAILLFQQALSIWTKEHNRRMMAWCLTNLGSVLRPLKRYQEAIDAYQKAINLFEEAGDPVHLSVAWMNLGNVYLTQDDAQTALGWYEKANVVFEQVQEQLRLAQIHMNMGMAYYQQEVWDKAETFFHSSIKKYETVGNIERVVNGLDALGLTYAGQHLYLQAIETFQEALRKLDTIKENVNYQRLLAEINTHLDETIQKK